MNNILTGPSLCSFQVTDMSYYARPFPLANSLGNAPENYNNYDEGNTMSVFQPQKSKVLTVFNFIDTRLRDRKREHSGPLLTNYLPNPGQNAYYVFDDNIRADAVEHIKRLRTDAGYIFRQDRPQEQQPQPEIPVNPSLELQNNNNNNNDFSPTASEWNGLFNSQQPSRQSSLLEFSKEQLTSLSVETLDQQMKTEISEFLTVHSDSLTEEQLNQLNSLLHYCCLLKCPESIDTLLNSRRVNIEKKTLDGSTALHLATRRGHYDTVCTLIRKYSADFNAADGNGFTALDIARIQAKHAGTDAKANYDRIINFLQVAFCLLLLIFA
jgi:hypothetical protein